MKTLFLVIMALVVTACGDRSDELRDRNQVQSEEDINAQDRYLTKRANEMKNDIEIRRSFLDATEGLYEGSVKYGGHESKLRLILTQPFPRFDTDRVQTLQELEFELQNLYFDAQILQWSDGSEYAGGCIVEDVRPDMYDGSVRVVEKDCPNAYHFYLGQSISASGNFVQTSRQLLEQVLNGSLSNVEILNGNLFSKNRSDIMIMNLEKVE